MLFLIERLLEKRNVSCRPRLVLHCKLSQKSYTSSRRGQLGSFAQGSISIERLSSINAGRSLAAVASRLFAGWALHRPIILNYRLRRIHILSYTSLRWVLRHSKCTPSQSSAILNRHMLSPRGMSCEMFEALRRLKFSTSSGNVNIPDVSWEYLIRWKR